MGSRFKMKTLWNSPDRKLLIIVGAIAVFTIALSIYAHSLPYFPGDLSLTLLFQSLDSDSLLLVMKWISSAFEGWRAYALVSVVSIIVWWRLGKLKATLAASAGFSSLLIAVLKSAVDRPRPTADLVKVWEVKHDPSFPSGHAFYIMAILGLAAYLAFTYIRNPALRTASVTILIILILLTGISRIYLGAHWPSDVLGGYMAGAVIPGMLIWLDRALSRRRSTPPN